MKRNLVRLALRRLSMVLVVLALPPLAFAGTSLRLGATFPGWEKLSSSGVEGRVEEAAVDLARDYARQLGRYCSLPEAFLRERSSSLRTALLYYEGYLPYGAREEVLLDSLDQRVSVVHKSFGGQALVVMVDMDELGVSMTVCGI